MVKEIEIPEGYEARIEGNKIILEPKENEDERIRKTLIAFICEFAPEHLKAEFVSYLEKQKEQKTLEEIAEEVTKDRITAIRFLKSAGIMDENGELAEIYRSDPDVPDEEERMPLDFVSVGDVITYYDKGKKGIMLVSSFDYGDGDLSKSAPRCKWGITAIDGTPYGNWAPGSPTFFKATVDEIKQLIETMPSYVKEWWDNLEEPRKIM